MKNIAPPISNKQKKSRGSLSNITNLAAATNDNDTDSVVDQDDDDHVVLAGIPNHSFLSLQALEGDILENDDNKEDDNNDDDNDDDGHFGMEYNATVMMEGKTLLLLSIKPDYQLVGAVLMLLQVLLMIFPLFLGMD